MKRKNLIYDSDGHTKTKEILIFDDVNKVRILSNSVAWRVMNLLSKRPSYPAQIAKDLNIYEQSAYYYVRKLASIGAVSHVDTSLVHGGTARLYKTLYPAYGIEMKWGEQNIEEKMTGLKYKGEYIMSFFNEFISETFNGFIIVGSPDPHGRYKSSSRDGHYAIQLAFFLGTICKIPQNFLVKLDVDAKAEKITPDENIISIGGPGTNIVTAEYNKYLPIKFNEDNFWSGLVSSSGRTYTLDNHGLIAKIRNPFSNKGSVIVLAGVRSLGTKSAILALTNYGNAILKSYSDGKDWAQVVQGFDMDSDGKIDNVDVLEEISVRQN